jgi:hypothetical protein
VQRWIAIEKCIHQAQRANPASNGFLGVRRKGRGAERASRPATLEEYTGADIDVRWSELIGRECGHVRNRMNFCGPR